MAKWNAESQRFQVSFSDRSPARVEKHLARGGTVLDLRLKYIGDAGLEHLAGREELAGLTELNLERNEITDRGVRALAESQWIRGLRSLHLERNSIGEEGAKAIARSSEPPRGVAVR